LKYMSIQPDSSFFANFRKSLHAQPRASADEHETIDRVVAFLHEYTEGVTTRIVHGTGLLCQFNSGNDGKHVLVRGDVDALPIQETSGVEHASTIDGLAHSCGHDGHTAILCCLAVKLTKTSLQTGKVTLLFQPAEEIGAGAELVLKDPEFQQLDIDQVIALHNIPAEPLGTVLVRNGIICAASTGVVITFMGETGHAASPQLGKSPINPTIECLTWLNELPEKIQGPGFGLRVTIAGFNSGGPHFGVAPAESTIWCTLRTLDNLLLSDVRELVESKVHDIASKSNLACKITFVEHFDATYNNDDLVSSLTTVLKTHDIPYKQLESPFLWSEDFGRFTSRFKGLFFGIGAGVNCYPLHHSSYDFPDDLIESAAIVFDKYVRNQTQL